MQIHIFETESWVSCGAWTRKGSEGLREAGHRLADQAREADRGTWRAVGGFRQHLPPTKKFAYPGGGERQIVQPLWKTEWRFLEKLDLERPCDPTIPLPDINPEELKAGS